MMTKNLDRPSTGDQLPDVGNAYDLTDDDRDDEGEGCAIMSNVIAFRPRVERPSVDAQRAEILEMAMALDDEKQRIFLDYLRHLTRLKTSVSLTVVK